MVKVRIQGLPEEVSELIDKLGDSVMIPEESGEYKNRSLARVRQMCLAERQGSSGEC